MHDEQRAPQEEELRRILPVVELIRSAGGGWGKRAILSVDTTRARVARLAVQAGCDIVNDISGGLFDPDMARAVTAVT